MSKHYYNIIALIIGLAFTYVLIEESRLVWLISGILLLSSICLLLIGIFSIRINYFIQSVHSLASDQVLLTFDDGPIANKTAEFASVLVKHDVGAIFFVIGKKADQHPELIKTLVDQGFILGNHTYTHANNFAFQSTKAVEEELTKTEELLGANSLKLFRPPVGITNPNIARAAKKLGLKTIGWNIRSLDTVIQDQQTIIHRIEKKLNKGNIVLLHDTGHLHPDKLDSLITSAKARGIKFAQNNEIHRLVHD